MECKLEAQNKYSNHAIMVLEEEKNKKSKRKTSKNWINGRLRFPPMNTWRVYSTEAIISENQRAAPEGKWVPSGGIEM